MSIVLSGEVIRRQGFATRKDQDPAIVHRGTTNGVRLKKGNWGFWHPTNYNFVFGPLYHL